MFENKKFIYLPCSAAVTDGYCVSISTDGATVAMSATATLNAVVGVAMAATTAAGQIVEIQTYGFCDHFVTDGNVTAPGATQDGDLVLYVLNGGTVTGSTAAEMDATTYAKSAQIIGKNLVIDSGTVGAGFLTLG